MITENEFFRAKRPWSRIKDKVIGSYLVPYLKKVSRLGHRIVIVDAFAGQGIFADDGSKGSPVIICEAAEKQVPGQYLGIFVNKEKESHIKLETALKNYIDSKKAIPILGNAQDLLKELKNISPCLFRYFFQQSETQTCLHRRLNQRDLDTKEKELFI